MDNEKIDKILEEKLQNKIVPTKEFEDKIKHSISEEVKKQKNKKSRKYKKISFIVSIAAMLLIISTVGINLNKDMLNKNPESYAIITGIEPTRLESGILASDSEFVIYTEGENLTKESVQKSIYIEPALDYTIEKTENQNEYKLKFKQNIPDNTIVKLQYVKDKITENSWAYQTSSDLSVVKTYPDDGASSVSKNTSIEIHLSYANAQSLEENVTITPTVKGEWEHIGKIWRLKPQEPLKVQTEYKVRINKGIKAEKEVMQEDYTFSFYVTENENDTRGINPVTKTIDRINTYKSDEPIKIFYNEYDFNKNKISTVKISKFKSSADFIDYLENGNYSKSESQGDFKFTESRYQDGYRKYLQLNKNLPNGYYVASIQNKNGIEIFNTPIQINDLSCFAAETEKDVIVWVGNDQGLQKDVSVKYLDKEQKTNIDGIAKFDNILDGSENVKYASVGNDENKLIVGLYNYYKLNYPTAYIYTDRPLYKNTDCIKIWGFVPLQLFNEKVADEFYISFNEDYKQKIKVDENGSFNFETKLDNYIDTQDMYVQLYYKNSIIASRSFSVKNYELQNYNYEIITDKNYAYVGTNYEFDVKVEHITGMVVPNKSILVRFKDKEYRQNTGEDGIAHFSIKVTDENENLGKVSSDITYAELAVYNGDLEEYTDSEKNIGIYIIHRNVYAKRNYESDEEKIILYKLANNRTVNVNYDLNQLYDGTYETDVQVKLIETVTTRVQNGTTYNEYTNKQEPIYHYITNENVTNLTTIKSTNGNLEIDRNGIKTKKSTDEVSYNYTLEYVFKDLDGKPITESISLGNMEYANSDDKEIGYIYDEEMENYSSDVLYEASKDVDHIFYYTYRYLLKKDISTFSIGDKVKFTLAESTKGNIKEIQNNGKLLTMVFKENINDINLLEESSFEYEFTKSDFPGCKITSAYFYNGEFYRMPIYYFDFKEEDRKVDVEIKADKDNYKPGDEVTLSIKTTKDGKPVKSVVNVSVANKAVFNIEEDYTNILEQIYFNIDLPIYTYSSLLDGIYKDNPKGGGGGGGEPRGNFGDTLCFETVQTNENGEAKVTFKLLDNITTYRATVHSVNKDLYVGVNTLDITSKLDFFVQSTMPRNVKETDDLVLNATSIADEKYSVDYEFHIKELNKTLTTTADTNTIATVNFGKLKLGKYHVIIKGKHENFEDMIEYEFDITNGTQIVKSKNTVDINNNVKINPTKNPVVLEIYSKDMENYLKYIDFVKTTVSPRLDTQISYNKIIKFEDKIYNTKTSMYGIDTIGKYRGENALKNLENSEEDRVLTALVKFYAEDYYKLAANGFLGRIKEDDNLFEIYLEAAAKNETVLVDLQHLKNENDISNYNKLLLTLSFEFLGDFQDARELYNTITLSEEEQKEYKSLEAIINTFINKEKASTLINELIEENPSDEYVRFAIISLLNNVATDINKTRQVTVKGNNFNKQVELNGLEVKTIMVYDEKVNEISFETNNTDLKATYYYQESLDNIKNENITQDMKISIDGDLKKNNTVKLVIEFQDESERNVRIALPNSLRLANNYKHFDEKLPYYIKNNNIDYFTLLKYKGKKKIEIPLVVSLEGDYKFESIVWENNGKYHISNPLDLKISK